MKSIVLAILLFVAAPLVAQQATLTTPETLSATKIVVASLSLDQNTANITVNYQASDSTTKRSLSYATVSQAELVSFLTALGSARASETGAVLRRMNFRVIGWMADNSKLLDASGAPLSVTLVP